MSIPFNTTLITVLQPQGQTEYDPPVSYTVLATNVRAVIGSPSGARTATVASEATDYTERLNCDPFEMPAGVDLDDCIVLDQQTGLRYAVQWHRNRFGFGVDHIVADLAQRRGQQ